MRIAGVDLTNIAARGGAQGGAGVGRSDIRSSFQIQARQLDVPNVAIAFKTIGLSFSFDGMD